MAGSYKHTEDLLALEVAAGPSSYNPSPVGSLRLAAWKPYLSPRPDQRFAAFLRRGFWSGFRISGDPSLVQHSSPSNMPSAVPGKFRLIINLSSSEGASVSDAISPELASVQYTTVRQAALKVAALGKGALLAKMDLHSAYRKVPVHRADHPLYWTFNGEARYTKAVPPHLASVWHPKCSLLSLMHWHGHWLVNR